MEIRTFGDLVKEVGLPENKLKGIEKRLCAATQGVEFRFTDLQKKAFENEDYWISRCRDSRPPHVLVQGATSAGKTLVSEMAVIECLHAKPKKKVIILVPLKAMVRERREHFAADLPDERVYASSSDFQDHDMDIINGNYDVAIVVYEKFFAILSQPANQMLNECGLLVVDELQMLSSEGRGPKLEIGIQKVMRHNAEIGTAYNTSGTYTRIMCLTTCDCKVDYIKEWLHDEDKEPLLIRSDSRPVGLEEYVLQVDGKLVGRYLKGERDDPAYVKNRLLGMIREDLTLEPEPLEVDGFGPNQKPYEQKRNILKVLLKNIYEDNPNAKVLVFASEKRKTREIAEFIAGEKILPYAELSPEMNRELDLYDNDESQDALKRLMPYGIAFHNSTLSTALREFVEETFMHGGEELPAGYGGIKLIVATETLTVGMNMPVDVMILYDTKVPRGKENKEKLNSQEYKNFVGRAGRLGQSNRVGQSFILALNESETREYWDNYVHCRMEDIKSSLILAQEEVQAPYYLSLLSVGKKYSIEDLEKLQRESFSKKCGGKSIRMEQVMESLVKAFLCTRDDDDEEDEETYKLTGFGQQLAPYALSLDTCKLIYRYFLNGGRQRNSRTLKFAEEIKPGKGGMPEKIQAREIDNDKYLLDILYLICKTKEVENLSLLRLPTVGENVRIAKDIIWKRLEEMTAPGGEMGQCSLWGNSGLQYLMDTGEEENEELQAVMRAILLWHWTKGEKISEIRSKTGFGKFLPGIYTGDLARLAEVASYELDAIYRCASFFTSKSIRVDYGNRGPAAMYALSTRVNYGMPRELVIIANRHLYGMDRLTVLMIGEAAKKYQYDNPARFLAQASTQELEGILTEAQRSELVAMIDRIYIRDDLEGLLASVQVNPKSRPLSAEEANALRQISALRQAKSPEDGKKENQGQEENSVYELLEDVFSGWEDDGSRKSFFTDKTMLTTLASNVAVFQMRFEQILTINVGDLVEPASCTVIGRVFERASDREKNLLLVREKSLLERIEKEEGGHGYCLRSDQGQCLIGKIDLVMTVHHFAALLVQTIALDDTDCGIFARFMKDTSGVFAPKSIKNLYYLLKNYERTRDDQKGLGVLNIVCDFRNDVDQENCEKLFMELSARKLRWRRINWGEQLLTEAEGIGRDPFLLYLNAESLSSLSVAEFFDRLRKNHFRRTIALFDSEKRFEELEPQHPYFELPCFCSTNAAAKAQYVYWWCRDFGNNPCQEEPEHYLIGVSYSHTKVQGREREEVTALRQIVEGLNHRFGEHRIVFDENPSFRSRFMGNSAGEETLKLYERCDYYLILNDHYYLDGDACRKEENTIRKCLEGNPEYYKQHIWYLLPKNDSGGSTLFDPQKDYSYMLDGSRENIDQFIEQVFTAVVQDQPS